MAKTSKTSETTKPIKIGPDLRIGSAAATFEALRDVAARGRESSVAIDARQVERADAAGLQALLAGWMALKSAGKTASWAGCSEQLKSAAGLLGLADALELPQ